MVVVQVAVGAPPSNLRQPTGKPPGNHRENHRQTARKKPRFWVTFASLNKRPEWLERASPTSFFGPWGGLP